MFVRDAANMVEGSPTDVGAPPAASEPWLGLEFRHLAALQAVADEGSFNGAARRLGYTQSAISQQIASLERIVGLRVVERVHGKKRSAFGGRQDSARARDGDPGEARAPRRPISTHSRAVRQGRFASAPTRA